MSTQLGPGFVNQVEPPVLVVSLIRIETATIIKNEPPESEIVEIGVDDILSSSESDDETITDIKDIDIEYHPVCEDGIKSETVPTNMLETEHLETENIQLIKTKNITQRNETEETSDGNVSKGTGQVVVEVQGNLETEQLVLNYSDDLNDINTKSRKANRPEKINFARCVNSNETTLWETVKEKIKTIKARVIPVKAHEYTSLTKGKHVCNHCKLKCTNLNYLKLHIINMHRKVATMYQCPYCSFKTKWKSSLRLHNVRKHKGTKDIQCHLCELKFVVKYNLIQHMKMVHLKRKQLQDGSELCLVCGKIIIHKKHDSYCSDKCAVISGKKFHCDICDYKTTRRRNCVTHKLIHLEPKKIQYFYCYHCPYKSIRKGHLKHHIFRHFKNEVVPLHCYICDFVTVKRDLIFEHFKKHSKHHSKLDDTEIYKYGVETSKKREKRYHCDECNYNAFTRSTLNKHKLIHLKPEEIQYFYCYHCSFKTKHKDYLKYHIFRHFKNENVPFHCYICDFMTPKRDLIVEHFKKHPEHRSKRDETKFKYQLEIRPKKIKKRYSCNKCNFKTFIHQHFKRHKLIHLKPEDIEYFYCYHCSYKAKWKPDLKKHIFIHFKKEQVKFDCHICDFMTPNRDLFVEHFKKHFKHHSKNHIKKHRTR